MAVPTSSKSMLDLVGSVKILPGILWSLQEMLDMSRKLMDLGVNIASLKPKTQP